MCSMLRSKYGSLLGNCQTLQADTDPEQHVIVVRFHAAIGV